MIHDFSTDIARCMARANYATGRAFCAVANEKPYTHIFDTNKSVCVKCGKTEEQIVEDESSLCTIK